MHAAYDGLPGELKRRLADATATLERHYRVLSEAFAGQDALICYAMKANSNQAVLKTLARLGAVQA